MLGLQSPDHPLQDSSYLSEKAGLSGDLGEELDLSFLPDELSTQDDTGARHRRFSTIFIFNAGSTKCRSFL